MSHLETILGSEKNITHLRLPEQLRQQLSKPIGILFKKGGQESPQKLVKNYLQSHKGLVIAVGDVVSETLITVDVIPHLIIIDKKTLRGQYSSPIFEKMVF